MTRTTRAAITRNAAAAVRRHSRQALRILQEGGARELGTRALHAAARRMDTGEPLPVRAQDVRAADLTARPVYPSLPPDADGRLTVNWVTTPPARGSGGHTTMMRLAEHLESLGHTCRFYLYDTFGGQLEDHERVMRSAFPRIRGPVHDVADGMQDAHYVFATAWITAYAVYNDRCAGDRLYLVQDYEPWFYPVGDLSVLAENTYRMGFHGFTAGRFLADKLASEFGMSADWFDFGSDAADYSLSGQAVRDGVVFYARRTTPRRALELGKLALQIFSEQHPHHWVHFYGEHVGDLGPRFVDHGLMSPQQLNSLYNRCSAGLSLSMTNVSLVPLEMLAAGCVPVVNDALHNRVVLTNDHVSYADATPHALAATLAAIVDAPRDQAAARAEAAAASVSGRSWDAAGEALTKMLTSRRRG